MEANKDTNVVFAVMVAVCPRFDQAAVKDEMNKAIEEYKATDEMVQLAEKRQLAYDEWQTANATEWYKKREEYRYYANKYNNLFGPLAFSMGIDEEGSEVAEPFLDII